MFQWFKDFLSRGRTQTQPEESVRKEELDGQIRRAFYGVFGFYPPEGTENPAWQQEMVDRVLAMLAIRFHTACKEQTAKLKHVEITEPADIKDRAEEFSTIALLVEREKKFFWGAHNLAKEVGFSIKEKSNEYLPAGFMETSQPLKELKDALYDVSRSLTQYRETLWRIIKRYGMTEPVAGHPPTGLWLVLSKIDTADDILSEVNSLLVPFHEDDKGNLTENYLVRGQIIK